jgi:hypothetical protein
MRDDAAAWRRRAATIARRSAGRLQERLDRERVPEVKQRLSRRIAELRKIAEALDVPASK